jgi:hypothetical protein
VLRLFLILLTPAVLVFTARRLTGTVIAGAGSAWSAALLLTPASALVIAEALYKLAGTTSLSLMFWTFVLQAAVSTAIARFFGADVVRALLIGLVATLAGGAVVALWGVTAGPNLG